MITKTIAPSEDVLNVLTNAQTEILPSGETTLRITQQLDRKLYEDTNKVLEALGGKWVKKARAHVFSSGNNPLAALTGLSEDGEIQIEKLDFFPTPAAVISLMLELAEIPQGVSVLEPSAGEGAICEALVAHGVPKSRVHFCELDPVRHGLLERKGYTSAGKDFLQCRSQYHRIVMNPPFSGQRDIDHVTRAFDCLMPSGKLVAVMAEGFVFRQDKKAIAFRELLDKNGRSVDLPAGAFKESGTGVKTRIVVLDKKGRRGCEWVVVTRQQK